MVAASNENLTGVERIWAILDEVMDPEVPVISVVDLGIVREVVGNKRPEAVFITPTYSGCPATLQIENDIRSGLARAGFGDVKVLTQLSPAWTSDWISDKGRAALKAFGISPPAKSDPASHKSKKPVLFEVEKQVQCPHCDSLETSVVSEFGSTACKALWKCHSCKEPFDYFKCI